MGRLEAPPLSEPTAQALRRVVGHRLCAPEVIFRKSLLVPRYSCCIGLSAEVSVKGLSSAGPSARPESPDRYSPTLGTPSHTRRLRATPLTS